jgi:hypothetical protein
MCADSLGDLLLRYPITGSVVCCARAGDSAQSKGMARMMRTINPTVMRFMRVSSRRSGESMSDGELARV